MELKGYQRSRLLKLAHDLKPVVMLGSKGLSPEIISQTAEMLEQHELIKVKFVDYKKSRDELSAALASETDSALIRVIGNIAVLYRRARKPENRKITLPERRKS